MSDEDRTEAEHAETDRAFARVRASWPPWKVVAYEIFGGVVAMVFVPTVFLAVPWFVMITVGIMYHAWAWPPAPLSLQESTPFAVVLAAWLVPRFLRRGR